MSLSFEKFVSCVKKIIDISNELHDGWELHEVNDKENGIFIKKKCIQCMKNSRVGTQDIFTFEYNIAYSISYSVPVLCLNIWRQDGSLVSMEDYWNSNSAFQNFDMYTTLTQMDHPVLCRPFLTLHTCRTQEVLQLFTEKSKNPIISWLTTVGPFVNLRIPGDYVKVC